MIIYNQKNCQEEKNFSFPKFSKCKQIHIENLNISEIDTHGCENFYLNLKIIFCNDKPAGWFVKYQEKPIEKILSVKLEFAKVVIKNNRFYFDRKLVIDIDNAYPIVKTIIGCNIIFEDQKEVVFENIKMDNISFEIILV